MLELTKLAARYLEQYGKEKVAEITGVSVATVPSLIKQGKFPLLGVEKLLAFDPAPIHALKPLYEKVELGKKLVILMPCNGNPERKSMEALLPLFDPKEMDVRTYSFNNLHIVRNALAAQFLAGPWEWSYWHDADSVPPNGNADSYYRTTGLTPTQMPEMFASVHAIYRMLVHKKTIVSGNYIAKRKGGTAQFGGGDTANMMQTIRRGPQDRVLEVPWVGFGGVLVHRRVFEDIANTYGDELKHNNAYLKQRFGFTLNFFSPLSSSIVGDDLSFCARAEKAGHKSHVDLAVQIGHVGAHTFTFVDC